MFQASIEIGKFVQYVLYLNNCIACSNIKNAYRSSCV